MNVFAETTDGSPRRSDDRRHVALVTTTIRVPRFLDELLQNAQTFGHAEQLSVVVVGDRKTPAEAAEFLVGLDRRYPVRVTYLDLGAQRHLLRRWPSLDLFLRYDSIQRRNVGYLQAAIDGAEVLVSVDDDARISGDDFIGEHLAVGRDVEVPVVGDASGWFNVCRRLQSDSPRTFYPRGYPKSQQTDQTGPCEVATANVRAVANSGLWLQTPDVDASTHLEGPICVTGLEPIEGRRSSALAAGTWCPMSSLNAAFDVAALPAIYLPVMHDLIDGVRIGRMDDVWMSYFLRAIADRLGHTVLFGPPLVVQERNPHDYRADLEQERPGYVLTERLVEYLREFDSAETTYAAGYLDLIYHVRESSEADGELSDAQREYLRHLTIGMSAWHAAAADVAGG